MLIFLRTQSKVSQTRVSQAQLLSPYNWVQCCYCIHQWKRPTFSPHQYRTNIVQTLQPLFNVKGGVLKVDGAVDVGRFSNEIFNEPMFCAVGQLLAALLGFAEGHLGWMSPFSCTEEEYHDNVAWCHSGHNSLRQGGYCSKMKQGGVELCNEFLWKTGWLLPHIGSSRVKILTGLDICNDFSFSTLEIFLHYICLFFFAWADSWDATFPCELKRDRSIWLFQNVQHTVQNTWFLYFQWLYRRG